MKKIIVLAAAVLSLAWAATTHADTYLGLYGGAALTPDQKVTVDNTVIPQAEFGTGTLAGGKLGHWMKEYPWVAAELNVWSEWLPMKDPREFNLVNFSGSLLLQWVCNPFRLYGGGGPMGTWANLSEDPDADDLAIGAMAQAGVEYSILPCWSVFGEYRFAWSDLDFNEGSVLKSSLERHEALGGINFRF
ncbi:MAG: hypothetical protein V2A77_07375 [Pseudomonadota bacterium]